MAEQPAVGAVKGFEVVGNTVSIAAPPARVRVEFLTDDLFRIRAAPGRHFTDPGDAAPTPSGASGPADMVVKVDYQGVAPEVADVGSYVRFSTAALTLRLYKEPLRFGLYGPDGETRIVEETRSLTWDDGDGQTTQYLTRGPVEQYFGGGMQNGRFSHRHKTIDIAVSYNWDDGGCPNSVPFYLSSAGYAVFRHTYAAGSYRFGNQVRTRHGERRFDAYYFVGSAKQVIDRYTELTGRPLMPPVYG
ncbi:MAG TPA: glycoside hydrolase, partial [Acidimicrobiia bacterium]|nr:glycoside hydrolase [Acidimicrobiia bacterium]